MPDAIRRLRRSPATVEGWLRPWWAPGTLAVAAVLALTSVGAAQAAGHRHRSGSRVNRPAAAAGWLARQLVGANQDHYVEVFSGTSYPDYGNTADGILAMDAAHTAQFAAYRATDWLAANVAGYTEDTCTPSITTYYPGSLGKAMLVAEAQHRGVHDFGGLDLVQALQAEETPAGQPNAGLYADNNADTSCAYESPITQAYAVLGLDGTGRSTDRADSSAVGWLAGQQCADGGYVGAVRTASSACARGTEDVDTTGYVVQALRAAGVHRAASRATGWLLRQQAKTGGFGSDGTTNANSTAIAVEALIATGHHRAAKAGQQYLAGHQLLCRASAPKRGAINYRGRYHLGGNQELTATVQGAQALAGASLGSETARRAGAATPRLHC